MRKLCILFLFLPLFAIAQKKQITLEDIYKKGTFRNEFVPGFAELPLDSIIDPQDVMDPSGKKLNTGDYQLSADKKRIIFFNGREPIYRRSSKSTAYLYDVATKKTIRLNEGKVLHPTFSPDGSKIAYVLDNNLWIYDVASGSHKAVTRDGKWNNIINGNCDWVYEEEFEFTRAFEWSPKGNYIAYYKFDETNVKEYNMTIYDNKYNKDYRYKYPKAGDSNSVVEIHIYNLATGADIKAQYEQGDIYIPRIKWTQDDNKLVVFWMNRHQNHLKLLQTNAQTGAASLLYEEKNKYFVEINDEWKFLKDGKHFLFSSEMNGYRHIYLYSLDGKTKTQVTKGNFEITDVNAVDEKNKMIYYTSAYPTPLDRHVFVTDYTGKKHTQLTQGAGWHRVAFNDNLTEFYDYHSDLNTPQSVYAYKLNYGKKGISAVKTKTLNENAKLKAKLAEYEISKAEFLKIPNSKGDTLNAWMLKPTNFDPNKQYPVLFCNYGGPGSQTVANRYGSVSYWHHMLAQRGYIIVSVDNTGTGFRGEEFKKKTYLQLGKYEIEDQIDAAKYLANNMRFVDKAKIGHYGWSYGGFMSSLAITKGADIFSAAIAVAPVTSWRYYDNIYTERYMRTPQENPGGYDDNSPINHVDKIKGKYLIVHGTADDNVHFQNAVQMIEALVQKNVDFESAYYPNKNHGIFGGNTSFHLWSKMTNWVFENLGNQNTTGNKTPTQGQKAF